MAIGDCSIACMRRNRAPNDSRLSVPDHFGFVIIEQANIGAADPARALLILQIPHRHHIDAWVAAREIPVKRPLRIILEFTAKNPESMIIRPALHKKWWT